MPVTEKQPAARADLISEGRLKTIHEKFGEMKTICSGETITPDDVKRIRVLNVDIGNELDRMLREAKDKQQAQRGELIAHDLRSPLGRIWSYADLCAKGKTHLRPELDMALLEFDQLLLYSEGKEQAVRLNLATRLQPLLDDYGSKLSLEGDSFEILAGPMAIGRIFKNLVRNADQAGADSIRIVFDKKKHLVKITDDAGGMRPDVLKEAQALFAKPPAEKERFSTITTTKAGGTGLGLVIIKEQLDKIGAKISVQSEEEKGTTFTIDFTGCVSG